MDDMSVPAPRSDDDLNRHLGETFDPVSNPRAAAVLVPLVMHEDELTVLLTRRTDDMPSHPGQVAFPGGKIDEGDEGPVGAALRETHEETGLERKFVETCGFLDIYQTRTGFRICPVVALVQPGFSLQPEQGEVAEIFEVPLGFLMNPANHQRHGREWEGKKRWFYAMPYDRHYIWGATAGMLRNFYDRVYAPGALPGAGAS
ncbi:MAG: CoA pyrophosphatase [Alphaproteobacteria bacterium]|nr:CoA pyrophosphatase [Alphaproteobacteria bacterium]